MKKILICDDEPDVVDTLSQILELTFDDTVKVTPVTDSVDALIAITETKFDLILTDYKMPKLNGIELLNNMYTINSSLNKETPVFIVTGNSIDINSQITDDRNITIISKPVKSDDLTDLVKSALGL